MARTVADRALGNTKEAVDPSIPVTLDLSSETVLIGVRNQYNVGHKLKKKGGDYPTLDDFTPVGLVQSASIQQQEKLEILWELASDQSYVLPGRVTTHANLSRVMFDGQSLLRALYGGDPIWIEDAGFTSESSSIFINLASKIFANPVDILFLFFNRHNKPMGGFYLENSYIYQHQLALNAQQVMIVENVSLVATKIVSLSVT